MRPARDDIDHAAKSIGTVHHGLRSAYNLNALHIEKRQMRQIKSARRHGGIIDADTVNHDGVLVRVHAADEEPRHAAESR
jgi:hypothetical protein